MTTAFGYTPRATTPSTQSTSERASAGATGTRPVRVGASMYMLRATSR